jgi:hypothetical protein
MRLDGRVYRLVLWLGLSPVAAAEPALDLFIAQAEARAQADVCIARVPRFKSSFEPAYEAWIARHSAELDKGRAIAEQRGMLGSAGPSVQRFASSSAEVLRGLPGDDLRRRCAQLVEGLAR